VQRSEGISEKKGEEGGESWGVFRAGEKEGMICFEENDEEKGHSTGGGAHRRGRDDLFRENEGKFKEIRERALSKRSLEQRELKKVKSAH